MTSEGKVIPEAVVKLRRLEDQRRKQLKELLDEVIERGEQNRSGLEKLYQTQHLESEVKWELIQRAKNAFNLSDEESIRTESKTSSSKTKKSSTSSSSVNWFKRTTFLKNKVSHKRKPKVRPLNRNLRPKSSYGIRSNRKGSTGFIIENELIEELSEIVSLEGESINDSEEDNDRLKKNKNSKQSVIKLKFNGLTQNSTKQRNIKIYQQLCSGGNAILIFDRMVRPDEQFTFDVRPHEKQPFSITLLIDSIRDLRISTCCEHKHRKGSKLSHFTLMDVIGGKKCYNCKNSKTIQELTNNGIRDRTDRKQVNVCLKDGNYSSDSDFEEQEKTVIERKSSRSSSVSELNYNEEPFDTYNSSVEDSSPMRVASVISVSSDENEDNISRSEVIEVEIHRN